MPDEPRKVGDFVTPMKTVYAVRKRCRDCGFEWVGNSFVPQPADNSAVLGYCVPCIKRGEDHDKELTKRPQVVEGPPPVFTRPTRAGDVLEDDHVDRDRRDRRDQRDRRSLAAGDS